MKRFAFAMAAIGLTVGAAAQARAGVVFSDNFNNGVDFSASNPYWLNNGNANGYVVTTTNKPTIFPGFPGYFDQNAPYNSPYYIEGPAPGSTHFLFDAYVRDYSVAGVLHQRYDLHRHGQHELHRQLLPDEPRLAKYRRDSTRNRRADIGFRGQCHGGAPSRLAAIHD